MMIRRFTLVAVCLSAFSLGAATAVAQDSAHHVGATLVGVATALPATAPTRVIDTALVADARHAASIPLSRKAMRETVGAGWWESLVDTVVGTIEAVVFHATSSP